MADHTTFTDNNPAATNLVPAAWFNDVNNSVYQGKNPSFVTSTGSANAYVVTLPSSTLTALATGQMVAFKASFTNSAAATLEVVGASSTGAVAIQKAQAALSSGVITSDDVIIVIYANSVWNIIATSGTTNFINELELQAQTFTAFTTGGTSTAYTLTPTPAIASNAENIRFAVEFHTASGAAPTLAISGMTALNLKYRDGSGAKAAIDATSFPTGWRSDVVHDGTDWIVLDLPVNGVGIPQFIMEAGTSFDLTHMGKQAYMNSVGAYNIPANASVAFPVGKASISGYNPGAASTITITTDTLRLAGTASTGTRTIAQYGLWTITKVASTVWVITGQGVS